LEYKNFKNSLKEINNYFTKLYKDNNIKNINIDNSLVEGKEKYIDNYVYNAIVNHADYLYNKEIKSNTKIHEKDIIQEIILKYYLKNKEQSRKDILKNYLCYKTPTQRFKNKVAIEQAIKNINDEMDDATKEFSKLFQNDNEKNNSI
jgi:hypothetical protein